MQDWWDEALRTAAAEFSGMADAAQITRIVLRLSVAALLGGLLGIEREHRGKAAGLRTHMLVCMGSALFMLVSQQAGIVATDLSRVIQGLVAGIGFLGAGTILKRRDLDKVEGLTTAAGIWMTAAIGVAAGLGLEVTAVLSTVLALVILSFTSGLMRRLQKAARQRETSAGTGPAAAPAPAPAPGPRP